MNKNFLATAIIMSLVTVICALFYFFSIKVERDAEAQRVVNVSLDKAKSAFKQSLTQSYIAVNEIKEFIEKSEDLPSVKALQEFTNAAFDKHGVTSEYTISYLDTSHIFKYSFTREQIDPDRLVGLNLNSMREQSTIDLMDKIIQREGIKTLYPVNLIEGWAGFPINFRITRGNTVVGYMTPIISTASVLNDSYQTIDTTRVAIAYRTPSGTEFDRSQVHRDSGAFTSDQDNLAFHNLTVEMSSYVENTIEVTGKKYVIGAAAIKSKEVLYGKSSILLVVWSALMMIILGSGIYSQRRTIDSN